MSTPILLISDCPSQFSGLARITRDLATVLAAMPEFRVATLGWMGTGSVRLPFHTYHMQPDEFGERSLPQVWDEFSQDEPGIVMTVFDLSRILWLARPEFCEDTWLRGWIEDRRKRRFKLWSYVPVDATGPGNRLTAMSRECLLGIDRILAYSPWGEGIIRNTIGAEKAAKRGLTWIPHGLNSKTFALSPVYTLISDASDASDATMGLRPSGSGDENASDGIRAKEDHMAGKVEAVALPTIPGASGTGTETNHPRDADSWQVQAHRVAGRVSKIGIVATATVPLAAPRDEEAEAAVASVSGGSNGHVPRVGIVGTNQPRKDWGLAAMICAMLAEQLKGQVRFWWHTDTPAHPQRHWNLHALVADFQLGELVEITTAPVEDRWLAAQYQACDVTVLPSLGEGFGYPLFESLACGTPCVHGDYAGGASVLATCGITHWLVGPTAWRLEGMHNSVRPVFRAEDFVVRVVELLENPCEREVVAGMVEHLGWKNLGHVWKRWLREGLGEQQS